MNPTIFLSIHEDKTYSKIAQLVRLYIMDIYNKRGGLVLHVSRDFVHSSELDRFEALHDSHGIFFLGNGKEFDKQQNLDMKIWEKLQQRYGHRPVFMILHRENEWIVAHGALINGVLREVAGFLEEGGGRCATEIQKE